MESRRANAQSGHGSGGGGGVNKIYVRCPNSQSCELVEPKAYTRST